MAIKLVLCTVGIYFVLPFGGTDGKTFESKAWEWSQGSLIDVLATFNVTRSYVISSITALFYNILERNNAIPIFINGILGVFIFYYAVLLANAVWENVPVNRFFAFLVAASPMLNVNSAVILRENYIILFTILASIQLAKYASSKRIRHVLGFLLLVILASFFHGGMILFALGLPLFLVFGSTGIRVSHRLLMGFGCILAFIGIMSVMDFGKLSKVQEDGLSVETLAELEANRREAGTAYLVGLEPSGVHDILWQAPVRSFYLLAKPFPWDVRSIGHFITLLDAMLWWLILWILWRNRASIRANPAALALFIASAVTVVAFSYGTSNFGTGVRHRTKFLVMGLVLISPFLPRFKLSR